VPAGRGSSVPCGRVGPSRKCRPKRLQFDVIEGRLIRRAPRCPCALRRIHPAVRAKGERKGPRAKRPTTCTLSDPPSIGVGDGWLARPASTRIENRIWPTVSYQLVGISCLIRRSATCPLRRAWELPNFREARQTSPMRDTCCRHRKTRPVGSWDPAHRSRRWGRWDRKEPSDRPEHSNQRSYRSRRTGAGHSRTNCSRRRGRGRGRSSNR
jgi:hypothetical protein